MAPLRRPASRPSAPNIPSMKAHDDFLAQEPEQAPCRWLWALLTSMHPRCQSSWERRNQKEHVRLLQVRAMHVPSSD